jgi:hypothetical protein
MFCSFYAVRFALIKNIPSGLMESSAKGWSGGWRSKTLVALWLSGVRSAVKRSLAIVSLHHLLECYQTARAVPDEHEPLDATSSVNSSSLVSSILLR